MAERYKSLGCFLYSLPGKFMRSKDGSRIHVVRNRMPSRKGLFLVPSKTWIWSDRPSGRLNIFTPFPSLLIPGRFWSFFFYLFVPSYHLFFFLLESGSSPFRPFSSYANSLYGLREIAPPMSYGVNKLSGFFGFFRWGLIAIWFLPLGRGFRRLTGMNKFG